ncbi:hypothetical protein Hanom_Chr08g00741321 [Helianthus anomalus]
MWVYLKRLKATTFRVVNDVGWWWRFRKQSRKVRLWWWWWWWMIHVYIEGYGW